MIQIDKVSQIAHLIQDISFLDFEKQLESLGYQSGYLPHTKKNLDQINLFECLNQRIANVFCFRYRSIEHLVCGGDFEINPQDSFHAKVAPRAATGADLTKFMVGSQKSFGEIKGAYWRLFINSLGSQWGLISAEKKIDVKNFLAWLCGNFIFPRCFIFSLNLAFEHKYKDGFKFFLLFEITEPLNLIKATQKQITLYEKTLRKSNLKLEWLNFTTQESTDLHQMAKNHFSDLQKNWPDFFGIPFSQKLAQENTKLTQLILKSGFNPK